MAEYPQGLIPISKKPLTFMQAALWYLRLKLLIEHGIGRHICPICGNELHFHGGEVPGLKSYVKWVSVDCPTCRIASDRHEYPASNYSPIELANGAMARALKEFERRAERR